MMASLAVFCGSLAGNDGKYCKTAFAFGKYLAQKKIRIVYGGGNVGLMGALADGALAENGEVIGVIPDFLVRKEVAHRGVDLRIVNSMHERKQEIEKLSDGFVALPGGYGTLDEFFEIVTWLQLGLHRKPASLLNIDGYFDSLINFMKFSLGEGFIRPEHFAMITVEREFAALVDKLADWKPNIPVKWNLR